MVILCDGDILKKNDIFEYSFEEVKPYLEYKCEAISIRRGILQMVKDSSKEHKFCQICKKMGKDDCGSCTKEFKEINYGK